VQITHGDDEVRDTDGTAATGILVLLIPGYQVLSMQHRLLQIMCRSVRIITYMHCWTRKSILLQEESGYVLPIG